MKRTTLASIIRMLVCASLVLLATGCPANENDIALLRRTHPPTTMTANVDTGYLPGEASTITMSDGVVMSVGCWDNCDYTCESPTLAVADTSILGVRPVQRLDGGQAEHVLVALAPGSTTLNVSSMCATRSYTVTVTDQ